MVALLRDCFEQTIIVPSGVNVKKWQTGEVRNRELLVGSLQPGRLLLKMNDPGGRAYPAKMSRLRAPE
jgi:hypothetical protein